MTPEGRIKKDIMEWLNSQPGCFAKPIQVSGVRGRRSPSKGVSDIVGSWHGLALAIEVKTKTGRLEDSQESFIASWTRRGQGISIVARSLEDVLKVLYSNTVKSWVSALDSARRPYSHMDYRPGMEVL